MTDMLDHKKKKLAELEAGNERAYLEIQQATGGRMNIDFDGARRELLIAQLVEWGVITEEQRVDFDIEFHTKVEDAIRQGWVEVRAAQAEQAKPKLVVPGNRRPKLVDPKTGKPLGS